VQGIKQLRQRRHRGDIGDTEHRRNRTGCYSITQLPFDIIQITLVLTVLKVAKFNNKVNAFITDTESTTLTCVEMLTLPSIHVNQAFVHTAFGMKVETFA